MMRFLISILALIAALAVGIYIGANPNTPVVGGLKDVVAPDKTEISTDQVQTLIENEFYRKIPDSRVTNGSINGMVKSLNDRFSHYFDPEQNKAFEQAIGMVGRGGTVVLNGLPPGDFPLNIFGMVLNGITVRGLDALDGTPVLDIKPYIPAFERKDNVRLPAWVDSMMAGYF